MTTFCSSKKFHHPHHRSACRKRRTYRRQQHAVAGSAGFWQSLSVEEEPFGRAAAHPRRADCAAELRTHGGSPGDDLVGEIVDVETRDNRNARSTGPTLETEKMLAYERQALLTSLQKLSDQHTRQKAMDECTKFAERLDAATLPGFLGVLHTTNDRHTVKCRSGVARLYGLVAHFHPDLIAPHLARVTDTLVARIKDRTATASCEACATALGEIVKELQTPHAVAQCLRPLLPALSETIEPVQAAAALSLACVLQGAGEVGDVAAGRVTAALLRALGHCCVGARGALLDAAAALLSHSPQSARLHAPSFVAPLLSACAAADAGAPRRRRRPPRPRGRSARGGGRGENARDAGAPRAARRQAPPRPRGGDRGDGDVAPSLWLRDCHRDARRRWEALRRQPPPAAARRDAQREERGVGAQPRDPLARRRGADARRHHRPPPVVRQPADRRRRLAAPEPPRLAGASGAVAGGGARGAGAVADGGGGGGGAAVAVDEEGEEGEMDLAASIRSASILMADGLGSRLYTLESHSNLEGQWDTRGHTLGGTLSDTASEGSADDVGAALEAEAERAKVAAEIQHALEEQETRHAPARGVGGARGSRLADGVAARLAAGAVVAEVAELDGASAADAALKALGVQPRLRDGRRRRARRRCRPGVGTADARGERAGGGGGSAEMGPTPTIASAPTSVRSS